jgi:hypothetical protein
MLMSTKLFGAALTGSACIVLAISLAIAAGSPQERGLEPFALD